MCTHAYNYTYVSLHKHILMHICTNPALTIDHIVQLINGTLLGPQLRGLSDFIYQLEVNWRYHVYVNEAYIIMTHPPIRIVQDCCQRRRTWKVEQRKKKRMTKQEIKVQTLKS